MPIAQIGLCYGLRCSRRLLQGFAFHLEVCSRVDLGGANIHVAEDISDMDQRDASLEHMHSFGVPKGVRPKTLSKSWVARPGRVSMSFEDGP